jgi:hypothetical protein
MTDAEIQAILSEKNVLIDALTLERDQLRGALNFIEAAASDVLAGYVAAAGWVTQNDDGSIVAARSFLTQ